MLGVNVRHSKYLPLVGYLPLDDERRIPGQILPNSRQRGGEGLDGDAYHQGMRIGVIVVPGPHSQAMGLLIQRLGVIEGEDVIIPAKRLARGGGIQLMLVAVDLQVH